MAAWVWTIGILVSMISGGRGQTAPTPSAAAMTDQGTTKSPPLLDSSGTGSADMASLNDLFSNTGSGGSSTSPLDQLVNNLFNAQGTGGGTGGNMNTAGQQSIATVEATTTASPLSGAMGGGFPSGSGASPLGSLPSGTGGGAPGSGSEILAPGVTTFDLTNLLTGAGLNSTFSLGPSSPVTSGPGTGGLGNMGTGVTNPIDNAIGSGPSPLGGGSSPSPGGPTGPGGSSGFGNVLSNQTPQGSQQGGSSSFGNPGSPNSGLPSVPFERPRPRSNMAMTMMLVNAMSGAPRSMFRNNAISGFGRGGGGNVDLSSLMGGSGLMNSMMGRGAGGGAGGGAGAAVDLLQNAMTGPGGSGGPNSGMMSGAGNAGGGAGGGGGLDALFGPSSSGGLTGGDLLGPAPSSGTGAGDPAAGSGSATGVPTTDLVSLLLGDLNAGGAGTSSTGGLSGGMMDPTSMLMGGTGIPGSTGAGGGLDALFNSLGGGGGGMMPTAGGGSTGSIGMGGSLSSGGGFAGFLG